MNSPLVSDIRRKSAEFVAQKMTASNWAALKRNRILQAMLFMAFIISGLVINSVQFIIYVAIRPYNKPLYRQINYYLTYSLWSQIVAVAEWWSGSTVRIYFADEYSRKDFGKEHALIVSNHCYELDFVMCWMICDKYHCLGTAKSFAKKSLRWIPIIGWGWIFAELVFLERNWEKDSPKMGRALENLMQYEDTVLMLLFAEGTRFTEEKYRASCEWAARNDLKPLKYHLMPRPKGFTFMIRQLKEKYPDAALYDLEVEFPKDSPSDASLTSVLNGIPSYGDIYIRKLPISEIPTDDEKQTADYLYNVFVHKDKVVDYYKENGVFPGKPVQFPIRKAPLINWISWVIAIWIPLSYYIYSIMLSNSMTMIVVTLVLCGLGSATVYVMISASKIKKGSSYGSTGSPTTSEQVDKENGENNGDLKQRSVQEQSN